jgi:predicted kinase
MLKKQMIIVRGLPGSGKSTWIKNEIRCRGLSGKSSVCSADDYFLDRKTGEYKFDPDLLGRAHSQCQQKVISSLKRGVPCVFVDNTHTTWWEFEAYSRLADLVGYEATVVEMTFPNSNIRDNLRILFERQKHGVPLSAFLNMWWRWEETLLPVKKVEIWLG